MNGDLKYMLKNTVNIIKEKKGSITVETAIAFPFFISIVVLFINIICFISGYETINYATDLTCRQMSDYAYLYHERVIAELGNIIKTKADGKLRDIFDMLSDKIPDFQDNNQFIDIVKSIISDYIHDEIDNVDNNIYMPAAEYLFRKNLSRLTGKDANAFADDVGVVNGLGGFNFSKSSFFDENNEIKLAVSYEIDLAIPFILTKHLTINHEYVMNAWMSGVGGVKKEYPENIWELDNFERGRRIRKIFGGNLPYNFPVISSFENGKATIIKSLDFTCDSYLVDGAIIKRLTNIIKDAEQYRGQSMPWGKDRIVIKEYEIKKKEIIIVIPSDEMEEYQKRQFDEAKELADRKNIIFRIEKYGYKKY